MQQFSFTMASSASVASGVTTWRAWPGQGESVTKLMPFRNFPLHSYTCYSDRHASLYWTSILRWISMGFTPSLCKKRLTKRCSSLVHVASGAAIFTLLLRRRVALLHRTATCRPLFKPWVSLLPTYRTIEQCFESCHTFKVFIWLTFIYKYIEVLKHCMFIILVIHWLLITNRMHLPVVCWYLLFCILWSPTCFGSNWTITREITIFWEMKY